MALKKIQIIKEKVVLTQVAFFPYFQSFAIALPMLAYSYMLTIADECHNKKLMNNISSLQVWDAKDK